MKVGDRVRPRAPSEKHLMGTVVRLGMIIAHVQWDGLPDSYPWVISALEVIREDTKSASDYYAAISGELV